MKYGNVRKGAENIRSEELEYNISKYIVERM